MDAVNHEFKHLPPGGYYDSDDSLEDDEPDEVERVTGIKWTDRTKMMWFLNEIRDETYPNIASLNLSDMMMLDPTVLDEYVAATHNGMRMIDGELDTSSGKGGGDL